MSTDDLPDGPEHDLYEETPPRSIFATMWFRALLVLMVLAGVVAVAAPYILDATNPPNKSAIASRPQSGPAPTPSPAPMPMASSFVPADTAPATPAHSERAAADTPAPPLPAASAQVGATDRPSTSDRRTPTEKASAPTRVAAAEKSAKSTPTEKSADKKDTPTVAAASETKSEAKSPAKRVSSATTASAQRASTSDEWWVQVGAYRDESTARKLAERLRDQNYTVQESMKPPAADRSSPAPSAAKPAGVDQYDVFVSNTSTTDLNPRLVGKGLTAEPSGSGVIVKPSLPLRDAVALSKELATDGLKVQVRRAGSPTGETTIPVGAKRLTPAVSSGESLHRVRVGAFSDHATAVTTLKELEAKGYKPFIARGGS